MAIIQTPSIAAVVEDQTPQLGGNLDCQDYQLQWSGSSQYIGSTFLGAGLTVSSGSNNLKLSSNGNLSINTSSAERAIFQSSGGLSVGGAVAPLSVDSFYDLGTTSLRWNTVYADSLTIGNGVDAVLTADAANELALKNSTNAQTFRVYNTDDGAGNNENLELKYVANEAIINTEANGTGTVRALFLATNGTKRWELTTGGGLRPAANVTYSLGTSSNNINQVLTKDLSLGTSASDRSILTSDAADTLAMRNSTTAQAFNIYNTYTDASNYERLEIKWDTNVATIRTAAAGTGGLRTLRLGDNSSTAKTWIDVTQSQAGIRFYDNQLWVLDITDSWVRTYRRIIPGTDSLYELGTTSARWATTYTDGIATNVETYVAGSVLLDDKNNVVLGDCSSGALTVNLQTAVGRRGMQYHIKKIDASANTVTIDADGTETIDGALTQVISTQYNSITVVSDGSNWFII